MKRSIVIALDGPAGSGKGTLARKLAAHYGVFHLDSGKLYRLVALRAENKHVDLNLPKQVEALFKELELSQLDNPKLSTHLAGTLAAKYSPHPIVRKYVTEFIRRAARENPGGIVVDGRDIGTVVLPHADVKLFVTAEVQERARRRLREIQGVGQDATYNQVLDDLVKRDKADTKRKVAPLKAASDAYLLDNSHLDIEGGVRAAIDIVEAVRAGRLRV
jgi:cytidylate kinase